MIRNKKNGFTLIEIIITLAIVAIVSTAIGAFLVPQIKMYTNASDRNRAKNLCYGSYNILQKELSQISNVVSITNNTADSNKLKYKKSTSNDVLTIDGENPENTINQFYEDNNYDENLNLKLKFEHQNNTKLVKLKLTVFDEKNQTKLYSLEQTIRSQNLKTDEDNNQEDNRNKEEIANLKMVELAGNIYNEMSQYTQIVSNYFNNRNYDYDYDGKVNRVNVNLNGTYTISNSQNNNYEPSEKTNYELKYSIKYTPNQTYLDYNVANLFSPQIVKAFVMTSGTVNIKLEVKNKLDTEGNDVFSIEKNYSVTVNSPNSYNNSGYKNEIINAVNSGGANVKYYYENHSWSRADEKVYMILKPFSSITQN